MDRRAWQAAVLGVTKSRTWLSDFHFHFISDFNSKWTENFQMYELDLEKAEKSDQIANIRWIIEKAREFQ